MTSTLTRQAARLFDIYYWQTAVMIAKNGLARQYRNSFLGLVWTLLQPLTMVAVYTMVMPVISKFSTPNYPLYIIVSLPLWTFFATALTMSTFSILNNSETLKRCMISSSVFPIADVLRHMYTLFVSFAVMYAVGVLLFNAYSLKFLLVPFFFIPVLMIIGSGAIAIAFLAPYVRDIGELIMLSMNMLFWLTPVVYPYDALPAWAKSLMDWNPFFIMIHPIQMLAYQHVLPGPKEILSLLLLTLIAISAGFGIFRACRRNYVYYL